MTAALAPGFADPVTDAQAVFRVALDAMARPGRIGTVATRLAALPPLHPATVALGLALFDLETPVWLDPAARDGNTVAFFRFHCGCPLVEDPGEARFAVIAAPAAMPPLASFDLGTDEAPETAATVIVQADRLVPEGALELEGPGIAGTVSLGVEGVPAGLWQDRARQAAWFPRGVDLLLTAGSALAALPRTTRLVG